MFLATIEMDLGGHKNRGVFKRSVRECFFSINSLNFNVQPILGELSKMP
jgi:hypothetical protein